jgi:glucosamine--fructose-6-phosphate aminotransferase (isomerizing)
MCGLFGFVYYGKKGLKGAEKLLENLAQEAAVRGTDATGYAFVHKGKVQVDKAPKPAFDMKYLLPKGVHTVMGHTRHTTQGNAKNNYNNHPFKGVQGKTEFAFAHNGVLDNEFEIRDVFEIKSNRIQTDSYVACQLMEKMKDFSMDSLRIVGESVEGMFTFTYMDDRENLYIIKNDSPLTLLHFPALQLYVYGSTDEIVFNAVANFNKTRNELIDMVIHEDYTVQNIPVEAGDILVISPSGKIKKGEFKPRERMWNNPLYAVAGCWGEYEEEEESWYKELLLDEAKEVGVTEKEFEKLAELFPLSDLEYYISSGEVFKVIVDLSI